MINMGRNVQAWALLMALSFSGPASLRAIYTRLTSNEGPCPPSCCRKAVCPMRAKSHRMPKPCPMSSLPGHPHQAMSCACSVAPEESSVLPPGRFDLRCDLPRLLPFTDLSWSAGDGSEVQTLSLEGYGSPPDHPPKALSA